MPSSEGCGELARYFRKYGLSASLIPRTPKHLDSLCRCLSSYWGVLICVPYIRKLITFTVYSFLLRSAFHHTAQLMKQGPLVNTQRQRQRGKIRIRHALTWVGLETKGRLIHRARSCVLSWDEAVSVSCTVLCTCAATAAHNKSNLRCW